MATGFSQVDLTQNEESGDWEFSEKSSNANKRKRHTTSSSSFSPEDFENASNSTKLAMIFEEILNLKIDQANTRELITTTNQYAKVACGKINAISTVTNQHTILFKTLLYKSIDSEARSRRNNLVFHGIKESRYENCSDLIHEFLAHKLQINTTGIVITRAHRVGPIKLGQRADRPIIANFMNYNDLEYIMSNAKTLKNCPGYSIDRDLPKEISEARKRLWGVYKDTKRDNPNERVRIVYPAKLLCGNRVVRDEFPDWYSVLNQSRITNIPMVDVSNIESEPVAAATPLQNQAAIAGSSLAPDGTGTGNEVLDLSKRNTLVNQPTLQSGEKDTNTSEAGPEKQNPPIKKQPKQSKSSPKPTRSPRSPVRRTRPLPQRRVQSASSRRNSRQQIPSVTTDTGGNNTGTDSG